MPKCYDCENYVAEDEGAYVSVSNFFSSTAEPDDNDEFVCNSCLEGD